MCRYIYIYMFNLEEKQEWKVELTNLQLFSIQVWS